MINTELNNKFKKVIINFVKDNNIKINDPEFVKIVRHWFEYLSHDYSNDNNFTKDFDSNTPAYLKLKKLHEEIVQKCIDFILNNEDVKKMIEDKKDIVTKEWNNSEDNSEEKYIIIPDVRMFFGIDHLDESVEAGYWVPSSDSSIDLMVGNTNVLNVV